MQSLKFRGYKLFHRHRGAAESMVRQIEEFPSFFMPTGERPWIVDCGANIGVSVLEWKSRWPQCRVLCFEPDPYAFEILAKNVEANDLPGVRCIQAAVNDCEDQVLLYGDIAAAGDARGNSIDPAWGQRVGGSQTTVRCLRLADVITDLDADISFLKLDIEGAEQRVLADLSDQLDRIAAIYVEVHETDASVAYNSTQQIERILTDARFTIESESRPGQHALPAELSNWQQRVGARQIQLLAWR